MINIRRSKTSSPKSVINENLKSDSEKEVNEYRPDSNVIQCYRVLYHTTKRLIRIEMDQEEMLSLT